MNKETVVISGVNLTNAGPLSVFRECLAFADRYLVASYRVVALVNSRGLFDCKNIEFWEFPEVKKNWFNRLWFEYKRCEGLSKELNPVLWFSLHDISPHVHARITAVYCHNPAPFYRASLRQILLDPKFTLFNFFYRFLYAINIRKNTFVVVQQDTLRTSFQKMFRIKNVVVAYPEIMPIAEVRSTSVSCGQKPFQFLYPVFPRVFKNIEAIGEAVALLVKRGFSDFKVLLTFSPTDTWYAGRMFRRYGGFPQIVFSGSQSRETIFQWYRDCDALLFPSFLETWGMPITEFKQFNKPMLLADLPYAHETVGTYAKVFFFNPRNPDKLADAMALLMQGGLPLLSVTRPQPQQPFARNWADLFGILLARKG
jgi:glycosyltransferase involved in cell wall biosynthesis